MALLDRLRQELNLAGKSAQRALDEGKLRLDLYRAKQAVDRFAQRFGYAVYRARTAGTELPPEEYTSHVNNLTAAEADVARIETLIAEVNQQRKETVVPRKEAGTEPGTEPGPD
ncbi:MAG TPA: hypothetical protein VGM67_10775 [Gemmatimonadaceae bacterium]